MFQYCVRLKSLNLNNFNTSLITNMGRMFYDLYSLESLDVNNFDTSSVTNMEKMFFNCTSLTSLNLKNFNTSSVKNMNSMFSMCQSLITLKIDNFDTSSVTDINSMFYNCSSLISLNLTGFDLKPQNVNNIFEGCNENMIYCIDYKKEYNKDLMKFLRNFDINCTDICVTYNSQKFIIEKDLCLDKCSVDNEYKYEYDNYCYEKCPNNTKDDGNYVCKIIDNNKNKDDNNLDNKNNIGIIIGVIVGVIVIIIIVIIIVCCIKKKKKDNSQIYGPLINNDDSLTIILTTVDQQINLPIPCKKNDIVKDILVKELSKEYSQYLKRKHFILCNGEMIDYNKTFEENNILDKNILILNEQDL